MTDLLRRSELAVPASNDNMFEKGATSREVKEKLGGTYYNILGKMQENGHRLIKEGSLFTLTHKDDLNKAKKAKK